MNEKYIRLAKRENNKKRNYLVLNERQCKHIPSSPSKALKMFDELGSKIEIKSDKDKVLFIGFAETATAIGCHIARKYGCKYITTTRDVRVNKDYLYFEEKHSHATEQHIDKAFLDKVISEINQIIFIEDEVTTGSTILSAISVILEEYNPTDVSFTIASIVNSMDKDVEESFKSDGIEIVYLLKKSHKNYASRMENHETVGCLFKPDNVYDSEIINTIQISQSVKANKGINGESDFNKFCESVEDVADELDLGESERILVMGTEEYMYPAIYLGSILERKGYEVRSHSTTRSPICVDINDKNYPLKRRFEFPSLYGDYMTYIYNLDCYDKVIVVTDGTRYDHFGYIAKSLFECGNRNIDIVKVNYKYEYNDMPSSYSDDDVTILLKNLTGKIEPEPTEVREKKIQSGVHYCEMLPIEYKPTRKYLDIYYKLLDLFKQDTANAVSRLGDMLYAKYRNKLVLVSLARAGLPIGILLKKYIRTAYNIDIPHYSISIIRGRGIDRNAMNYILSHHKPEHIQFVDGWTGKGTISGVLREALMDYKDVSSELAVLSDPALVTDLCGTHEDILIPSSCLNSTVSGLISRTILRDDLIGEHDFHGAVYYENLKNEDLSLEYIDTISDCFNYDMVSSEPEPVNSDYNGYSEVMRIKELYNVNDINFIKPGIGETTRVLLRRVPDRIIINKDYEGSVEVEHIIQLAKEKKVQVEYRSMSFYKCCGIILDMSDV